MSLTYYLYRLGTVVIPNLPTSLGYKGCHVLGSLGYHLFRRGRRITESNLRHILADRATEVEIAHLTRRTFAYILYNYVDLLRLPTLTPDTIRRAVSIQGWQHMEAALAAGRGAILVSAHLGNIDVIMSALRLCGVALTIPVERLTPPRLFDYISTLRMSQGLTVIPVDGMLLELGRTLRRGGIVGLAADRDITHSGQVVDFFGQPARLPDGHIRLALKSGAPLVVGFGRRHPDHTFSFYCLPPFHPPAAGTEQSRIAAGLDFVVRAMEQAIRQTPEQWGLTVPIWVGPEWA